LTRCNLPVTPDNDEYEGGKDDLESAFFGANQIQAGSLCRNKLQN